MAEPTRRISPWWERWAGWWADQQIYLRAEDPDGILTCDPSTHTAGWDGHLAVEGGRRAIQIAWTPGTPFVPPRIYPVNCWSAAHQLRDRSMCLLAPPEATGGWTGVLDLLFWLNQARAWFQVFEGQGLALPPMAWLLMIPLRPGPGYRDLRPGGLLLALPPTWAKGPPDRYGAIHLRVPRSGQGLAAVVAWNSDHPGDWPEGRALVRDGEDRMGTFCRPDPDALGHGQIFRRPRDVRRYAQLEMEAAQAGLAGVPLFHVNCTPGLLDAQSLAWVVTLLDLRALLENADGQNATPANFLHSLGELCIPIPALPLTPELLHQRRNLSQEPDAMTRIQETQIVLVGLGALGSEVAHLLAREGICRFYLIDGDLLLPGNVARHRADLADAGRAKVDVVREAILRVNPAAEVTAAQGWFDELLPNLERTPEPTLLVGATGAEESEHVIGEAAWHLGLPCLHAWLERDGKVLRLIRALPDRDPTLLELVTSPQERIPARPGPASSDSPAACADLVLPGSASDLHASANFVARVALSIAAGTPGEHNHWLFSPGGIPGSSEDLSALQHPYSTLACTLAR